MTKIRLKLTLALLVLAALAMPAVADEISEEDVIDLVTVEFTGVAAELYEGEMPGAPTIWVVYVPSDERNAICSDIINVTVYQATPPPWGTYDESVTIGDTVEVYGAYIEYETGCIVTLQGSEDYYFGLAEGETEIVDELEVEEEFDELEVEEEFDELEVEDDTTWDEEESFDCTCRDVAWGDSWEDKSKEQPLFDEGSDEVEVEEESDEVELEEESDEVEVEEEKEIFDCTCRDVAWGDSWEDKSKEQPL